MKHLKISIVHLLWLFSLSKLMGQVSLDVLSFYPLNNGNYWEYKEVLSGWDPEYYYEEYYYSLFVVGDTIMPNNKTYKKIQRNGLVGANEYERVDSLTGNVYRYNDSNSPDYECLIDSLASLPGDTSSASRFDCDFNYFGTPCILFEEDSVLGVLANVKQFQDWTAIPSHDYSLAQNFGFISSNICEFGCQSKSLIYAIINGIEYGTQLNIHNDTNVPHGITLEQNFPNPFNPETTIRFSLSYSTGVKIEIYNVLGEKVNTIMNDERDPGNYKVIFDASDYSSGIYIYRIETESSSITKKMLLVK